MYGSDSAIVLSAYLDIAYNAGIFPPLLIASVLQVGYRYVPDFLG